MALVQEVACLRIFSLFFFPHVGVCVLFFTRGYLLRGPDSDIGECGRQVLGGGALPSHDERVPLIDFQLCAVPSMSTMCPRVLSVRLCAVGLAGTCLQLVARLSGCVCAHSGCAVQVQEVCDAARAAAPRSHTRPEVASALLAGAARCP